jgi:hypothetical protein
MFGFLGRLLLRPVVISLLGAALLAQGYALFEPEESQLGFMRRNLAERLCTKVAADLPKMESIRSVAVLDLGGDDTGFLTSTLKSRIENSEKYDLIEESLLQKLLAKFGNDSKPVNTLDDAVTTARKLGADGVVFGAVVEFANPQNAAKLNLEIRMAERASGNAVFAHSYSDAISGSPAKISYWRARLADSSKGQRILIWILFALLLPLLAAPLIRRLLTEESNAINVAILACITGIDLFAALFLTGLWIPTLWTAATLVAALASSFYYNYRITSFIEELRE